MRSAEREHYGLAVYCARRFQGRGVPMEELIGEAEAALLWAASRFDESRGTRFSTYAIPVVLGALRETCRRAQPMHIPRNELRVILRADEVRQTHLQQEGREIGVREMADELGVEPERLGQMLAAQERMKAASGALDAQGAAEHGFEDLVLLRDAIRSLPSPYAQVVWLRFADGKSQSDVARTLGVGQPQVSRWEKQARDLLRDTLWAD